MVRCPMLMLYLCSASAASWGASPTRSLWRATPRADPSRSLARLVARPCPRRYRGWFLWAAPCNLLTTLYFLSAYEILAEQQQLVELHTWGRTTVRMQGPGGIGRAALKKQLHSTLWLSACIKAGFAGLSGFCSCTVQFMYCSSDDGVTPSPSVG
jgi:hypothetical protein